MPMQLSYFLAQLIGLVMTLFALSALFRPRFVRSVMVELNESSLSRLLFSFIALTTGLAIVLTHNVWVAGWPVIITVIGWGGVLKGFMAIAMPDALVSLGSTFYSTDKRTRIVLVLAALFGLYLAGVGFAYF